MTTRRHAGSGQRLLGAPWLAALLALGAGGARAASAQQLVAPGWTFIPSLTLSEDYDSNIANSERDKRSDLITRVTPGIGFTYGGPRFALLGNYLVSGEWYADNSDLSNVGDRQSATLRAGYLPDPRTVLGLAVDFYLIPSTGDLFRPQTAPVPGGAPGEPNVPATVPAGGAAPGTTAPGPATPGTAAPGAGPPTLPGVTPTPAGPGAPTAPGNLPPPAIPPSVSAASTGRRRTTVVTASPSVTHRLAPDLSALLGYTYTYSSVESGSTDMSHEATAGLAKDFTALDQGLIAYRFRLFETTDGGGTDHTTAHSVLLGYRRQLGPTTAAAIQVGPSFSEGTVEPDVDAYVTHGFRNGSVGLRFGRTQSIVVGRAGPQTVDRVVGFWGYQLPRGAALGISGGFTNIEDGTDRTYAVTASATYPLTAWARVGASYTFSYEDAGTFTIDRHVVTVFLTFAYPVRR